MAESGDRRVSERIPVSAGTTCAFAGRVEELGPVKIRDVSMQGIGLVLMKTVAVGSSLVITLSKADKAFAKTMLVKVAHVTPITGAFFVGGSFAEPLTYQEFTSLVM
jgi:hypothetical protein